MPAKKQKKRLCLGLMSGTSVDAIDASLVLAGEKGDELLLHQQFPYPAALRSELLRLIGSPETSLAEFTRLHYSVGQAFAESAERAIAAALQKKLLKKREDLTAIGSHGQTIFHAPERKQTLQIGEASLISVRTGVTTVSDFRSADTAAGGEGAPLLPVYHQRLFAKEARRGVAVHNLGGISNFTYLGPKNTILALDTGPANCLLDLAVQKFSSGKRSFDEGGIWAKSGSLEKDLLRWMLERPDMKAFRARPAPKSTGRELFSAGFLAEALQRFPQIPKENALRTLAEFSVTLMQEAYEKFVLNKRLPLSEIILAGGGAKNAFLLDLLRQKLKTVKLSTMEDHDHSSQALESQAFGVFALFALDGISISRASTTGVKEKVICGKISPGKNWHKAMT